MTEKAVIITTAGEKSVVEFEIGDSYDLLSKAVGGWIELVSLPSKQADLWLNEEGKIVGLKQNPIATSLFHSEYGMVDVICGNVIITGGADEDGETIGLSDEQVQMFLSYDYALGVIGQ